MSIFVFVSFSAVNGISFSTAVSFTAENEKYFSDGRPLVYTTKRSWSWSWSWSWKNFKVLVLILVLKLRSWFGLKKKSWLHHWCVTLVFSLKLIYLSMRSHVQRTVAGCFAVLRQLRSVRRSVPSSVFQTLIVSPVLMKLDFGNATLAGLPTYLLNRPQSVLNAAARSIAGLRRSDHVTDTLASFHWLRASEHINFKLAVLVYRALHGTAPRYLSDLLRRVADLPSRRRLRSATSSQLDDRPSRLVNVGDRSFASAWPKLWYSLPDDITSASSLSVFRKKLKTHLFRQSHPDVIF